MRGELQCCHVFHGPRRVVDHRNKGLTILGTQLGSRVFMARSCVIEAPRVEVGPDDTVHTTTRCCGWWAVVRCRLLIGSFKLKFDRLNTNLIV
jgi:hypothetical protein